MKAGCVGSGWGGGGGGGGAHPPLAISRSMGSRMPFSITTWGWGEMNRTLFCLIASVAVSLVAANGTAQQFELGDVIVSGGVVMPNPPNFPDYDPKLLWFDRNGQFKGQLAELFLNEHFYRVAFSPSGVLHAASSRGILRVTPSGQLTHPFDNDT